MFLFVHVFLLFFFISGISSDEPPPIVQTPLGVIVGSYEESFSGSPYKIFQSVPFALPPTGDRRFKPPVPVQPWQDELLATSKIPMCSQFSPNPVTHKATIEGYEDCLYLNIYVPNHSSNQTLPVLFAIHSGAFLFGHAFTKPKFIMDKEVIFVSANYRLGILGFLSTDDEHIPGNMGLKDQSMALKWTYNNIQYFGGDPKRITLIGNSAGGASVHFHYLSPLSKGLFQNGISFSGTALGAGKIHVRSLEKFNKLGAVLGCPLTSTSETVECLRNKPVENLISATIHFMMWLGYPTTPFGPVVEKAGRQPFIDRTPTEIINSGEAADALWITNLCSAEGLFPAADFISDSVYLQQLENQWTSIAPNLLMYNYTIPYEKHDEVSNKIRKEYLGKKRISPKNIKQVISLVGDRLFAYGAIKSAKLQAKKTSSSVLFWFYNYRALTSLSDYPTQSTTDYGVSHADDILMIIDNPFIYPPKRQEDREVQVTLLNFVTSVATNGHPHFGQKFEWKKVNPDKESLNVLHFNGPNKIKMKSEKNFLEYKFWQKINNYEN